MKKLFEELAAQLAAGQDAMLVSVVASHGSAPGGAGARMLVGKAGRLAGTVGGGQVEHRAEDIAARALREGRSETASFTLRHGPDAQGSAAEDIGMICGGDVTLWFQYIPATPEAAAFAGRVAAAFERNADVWLLCEVSPGDAAELALYRKPEGLHALRGASSALAALSEAQLAALASPKAHQQDIGGLHVYSEPLTRAGRCVVFGGGHVAQALVPLLSTLSFTTVVFDDRPQFVDAALFPTAGKVILGDFGDIAASLPLEESDYLVVVTRGHAADYEVLRQVLQSPHAYVGVIGSRSKTRAVNQRLLEAGIPKTAIENVYTPIGLSIGAVTPAEIAVSIAAQLIAVRAGAQAHVEKPKPERTDDNAEHK